jgi:hypothetical protein
MCFCVSVCDIRAYMHVHVWAGRWICFAGSMRATVGMSVCLRGLCVCVSLVRCILLVHVACGGLVCLGLPAPIHAYLFFQSTNKPNGVSSAQVLDRVRVTHRPSQGGVVLEWDTSPDSDMWADAVLTVILQVETRIESIKRACVRVCRMWT